MASLKEIKLRINSVQVTRKVTAAMKMVSSAKLRKGQSIITGMLPYQNKLESIVADFIGSEEVHSPYVTHPDKDFKPSRAAIVALSSNSSLCGSYNNNVLRELVALMNELHGMGLKESDIDLYAAGKKVEESILRSGLRPLTDIEVEGRTINFQKLVALPDYTATASFARHLMDSFIRGGSAGGVDSVFVIYHHFKSAGVQRLQRVTYLPLNLEDFSSLPDGQKGEYLHNYIVEPSVSEVINKLIPQVLMQMLYTCFADSYASEQAARTIAMQVATDNADNLINELKILYNKSRQQAITTELLDIVAGCTNK